MFECRSKELRLVVDLVWVVGILCDTVESEGLE